MASIVELTDDDLPLSPIFIDFLARCLDETGFSDEPWADQISEILVNPSPAIRQRARARLDRLILDDRAQKVISEVYRLFRELAAPPVGMLQPLHERYRFIPIVGLARTGGSYLTAELFAALGFNPMAVPAIIAHDGFPDAQPISLQHSNNEWMTCLLNISEYLAMLPLFFNVRGDHERIVVPKKLTKGVYAGGLFNAILGDSAEYVITIRHPVASCISTYEKSGGFPADGRFKTRSNIETWVKRDLGLTGTSEAALSTLDYFEIYARYWEQYYIALAMSGLTANRCRTVVPFGARAMETAASVWHKRFASAKTPAHFLSAEGAASKHPGWLGRGELAMQRVASVWNLVDLPFPASELQQCL